MSLLRTISAGVLIAIIAGCQASRSSSSFVGGDRTDSLRHAPGEAAIVQISNNPSETAVRVDDSSALELSYGNETFFQAAPIRGNEETPIGESVSGESYVFRNAPIDAVLNQILGEEFGLSYSIDPRISGGITLRLEGIVNADQAIAGLDAALNLQGYEIVRNGDTFLVQSRGSGAESTSGLPVFVSTSDYLPPGTSSAVLQIRYASTDKISEVAKSILPDNLIRFVDDDSGLVVLSGEPEDVSSGVQLLKSLDVNWLAAVSNALVPIQNAEPGELAADLEPILSRLGGVSVVPLERLQSLLIIARSGETLDQTRGWVARLDQQAKPTLARDLLIYEARYVNAEDLLALAGAPGSGGGDTSLFNSAIQSSARSFDDDFETEFPGPATRSFSDPIAFERDTLYENLSIRVDPGHNAIVARGPSSELQSLSELLIALDKPKRQVQIEATIVEVTLRDSTALGVQWNAVEDALSARFTTTESGAVTSLFPGVSVSYINTDVSAVVNALAATSDVEIVSSPRMMVLNNETARLQIGDQVPVITQSAVSITDPGAPVVNSTSYRDTGVILTVTPRIRAGGMVEVEVTQEVSNVAETTSSNIDSPTISQRSIESILAVPDGATAVLGGLMNSNRSWSETGVPFLKDVPIVGAAFRASNQTERRTELIVLIEPTVVLSVDPPLDVPLLLRNALIRAREAPAG